MLAEDALVTAVMITKSSKEAFRMGRRRRSIMSEQLKTELAKELGFYDTVEKEGWGGIRAKDAGNMVKRAIELAERAAKKSDL
ncbi:hypothetical protein PaelaDRAFT_5718 [Paenibacillus lactis 154]|uniref:Small, acid-soluble spore protein, alpha/beta type n=2 Tax=Paenibacillus TaxID=44249 RepID=G4HP07_9BACL|nr:hypothetical protein PaelaDRAFT_5718 [Paenibacillus lactis 154]